MKTNKVPWWAPDQTESLDKLIPSMYEAERRRQTTRFENMRRYSACYKNGTGGLDNGVRDSFRPEGAYAINKSRSVVDTVAAETSAQPISPMALTNAGNYIDTLRAKDFTRAMEGLFDDINYDELDLESVRDAEIYGIAAILWSVRDGKAVANRMDPYQLLFPLAQQRYGAPREAFYRFFEDRYVLAKLFPKREQAILSAPSSEVLANEIGETDNNVVDVYMAWRLPTTDESEDGKYVMCVDGACLEEETYTSTKFPFAHMRFYSDPKNTVYGLPLMAQLLSSQALKDELDWSLQRAVRNASMTAFIVSDDSDINTEGLVNDFGYILRKTTPGDVQVLSPQPINAQLLQLNDRVAEEMVQMSGANAFSASGQPPPGMNDPSGRAMRYLNDMSNRRNVARFRARERFLLDNVDCAVITIRKILEEDPGYSATYAKERGGFQNLKWKSVLLPEKECVWRVFSISALSSLPSAKFAELENLVATGAITMQEYKQYLDLPDTKNEVDLGVSDKEVIDTTILKIVKEGEITPPEPSDNLDFAFLRVQQYLNLFRARGVPDDKLELLREYGLLVKAAMDQLKETAAPSPDMPPSPGTPPGPGMPPGPEGPPVEGGEMMPPPPIEPVG